MDRTVTLTKVSLIALGAVVIAATLTFIQGRGPANVLGEIERSQRQNERIVDKLDGAAKEARIEARRHRLRNERSHFAIECLVVRGSNQPLTMQDARFCERLARKTIPPFPPDFNGNYVRQRDDSPQVQPDQPQPDPRVTPPGGNPNPKPSPPDKPEPPKPPASPPPLICFPPPVDICL